jgi:hypothetical protein
MEQEHVKGRTPFAEGNSKNTTNSINSTNRKEVPHAISRLSTQTIETKQCVSAHDP